MLFWNRAVLDESDWHDELQPIYARIAEPLTHQNLRAKIENTARENTEKLLGSERFEEPVVRFVPWVEHYTAAEYVALLKRDVQFYSKAMADAGLL